MRYAEYVQRMDYLPFKIEDLPKILNDRPIKRWAFLVHDKDEHEDGTLKEPHLHIEMELNTDQNISTVSSWFNDKDNRIQKGQSKNRKYMYENMCSYLIHETSNADGKYHYDEHDVTANFDFVEFINNIRSGVKESKEKGHSIPIMPILEMICKNEIPRIKIGQYLTNEERIKYKRHIDAAYEIRDQELAKETDRNMNVMYFYGEAGTGKTTFAKIYAKKMKYDVFVTGSSNDPLQGYQGQECIILDDLRGSDWKINDLLKILDNHTNSLAKSRYSNKLLVDCKLMIITSVQDIETLYGRLKDNETEPIEQLKRRCSVMAHFTNKTITFYQYSEGEKDYIYQGDTPNTIKFVQFASKNKEMISSVIDVIKQVKTDDVDAQNVIDNTVELGEIIINDEDNPFGEDQINFDEVNG